MSISVHSCIRGKNKNPLLFNAFCMEVDNYKMDRSVVKGQSFEEADDHVSYWVDKTPLERLNAACFIINQVYDVSPQTKVDKTLVVSRKHDNG